MPGLRSAPGRTDQLRSANVRTGSGVTLRCTIAVPVNNTRELPRMS